MKEKIEKLLDIETLDRNLFRGQGEGGEVASRAFFLLLFMFTIGLG